VTWVVSMFSPTRLYGFCASPDGKELAFHASAFHRLKPGGPGPISGEPVEVGEIRQGDKGPFVDRVSRLVEPVRNVGTIKSYDATKGWGFVQSGGGDPIFLHSSDLNEPWLPVIGTHVQFYEGRKRGRKRACWVRPDPLGLE
jgi:cold shock CspA family protein